MTHFSIIVALLVGVLGLLTGILGTIWRASSAWTRLKDSVVEIQGKLVEIIVEKEKAHNGLSERLTYLERKVN